MKKRITAENKAQNTDVRNYDLSKNRQKSVKGSKQDLQEIEIELFGINLSEFDIEFLEILDFEFDITDFIIEIPEIDIEFPEMDLNFPEIELPEIDIDILEFVEKLDLIFKPDFAVFTFE